MEPRILLFVPCYNCERQVSRVIRRIQDSPVLAWLSGILVVDDCSKDGTLAAAMDACPTSPMWSVASTERNLGLGGVHKAAFRYALEEGYTHALILHGDDQGNLDDILPLLQAGEHLRHGALLGSRFMSGSRLDGYSRFRIFGNYVFNGLFSCALRARVRDLGSGLNLFGESVMRSPGLQGMADGLTFNVHLLVSMLSRRREVRPMFFPVSWGESDQVSNVRLVRQTLSTARIVLLSAVSPESFLAADHRAERHASYGLTMRRRVQP